MKKQHTKKQISVMASEMGKIGGKKLSDTRGKKYMSEIGKKGASKRWSQKI